MMEQESPAGCFVLQVKVRVQVRVQVQVQLMMVMTMVMLLVSRAEAACTVKGPGSHQCLPCGQSNCRLSNANKVVTVGGGVGRISCATIESWADDNCFDPQECSAIQAVVLATSDPCGCKKDFSSESCPAPGFAASPNCQLCPSGKFIGDPNKVLNGGLVDGARCIDAWIYSDAGAFSGTSCSSVRTTVRNQCQCIQPGQAANPCIPVETDTCNPNSAATNCCAGSCKYLNSYGRYVCTTRKGDQPPANYAPPSSIFGGGGLVACFSDKTTVTTRDQKRVSVKDVKVGDQVLVDHHGNFETVYSFGHYDTQVEASYIRIYTTTSSSPSSSSSSSKNEIVEKPLELSPDHMVFLSKNKRAVPASLLAVGDELASIDGDNDYKVVITRIDPWFETTGAYAPFTMSGTLVVNDGIVASSFISMQEDSEYLQLSTLETPLTWQWLAHVSETPHRIAYRLGYGKDGSRGISQWDPYQSAKWILNQNVAVSSVILGSFILMGSLLWMVEQYATTAFVFVASSVTLIVIVFMMSLRGRRQ